MARDTTRVLLVHPEFHGASFWNYRTTCEKLGAKYPSAPLGLCTVAAMLPDDWDVRLIDRNTRPLTDADIQAADLVMLGAMMPQCYDALLVIGMCKRLGAPVCIGGPDPTSRPEVYAAADFAVFGEAEGAIDDFIADWQAGAESGRYTAPKFKIDVTQTPAPRYDLLRLEDYLYIGVQFSRGCPFMCEFCDIIELYGRVPRAKTAEQVLAELDRLLAVGHRGHVDFVDDNLIGNKKAVKAFLPKLIAWQEAHGFPFEFSTEASLNLADDAELMRLMARARFFIVFIGIESSDEDVLTATRKKQNTRRDIAANVQAIYAHGIAVIGGFIVGFDEEKRTVAAGTTRLIEEAAIPVAMAGLLYALPDTQLSRRLEWEGRLHQVRIELGSLERGDQCTAGLNFETSRPRADILRDYRAIVGAIYAPEAYFGRMKRSALALRIRPTRGSFAPRKAMKDLRRFWGVVKTLTLETPNARGPFWRNFLAVLLRNPTAVKTAANMAALYIHLGPFADFVQREIDAKIAESLDPAAPPPVIVGPGAPHVVNAMADAA